MQGKGAASPFIPCFLDVERDSLLVGLRRWGAFFAHRFSAHLNAMGTMNQAVEDAVRDGWVADLLVPARDRQLRSDSSLESRELPCEELDNYL